MAVLLELKENFKRFYNKYDIYIVPVAKFIAALVSFLMLNASIGYMDKLNSPIIAVLVSVICAFLSNGFTIVMLSIFMIAHLYAISVEFALIALCVVLLMYLLYFRFTPKLGYLLILTVIMCGFKIPYVIPVAVGLCSSFLAAIPVSFGVIIYYIINTASAYEAAVTNKSLTESMLQVSYLIESLVKDKQMIVLIAALAVTVIVVYIIRRLKIDYAWGYAIGIGSVLQFIILVVCEIVFKTEFNIVLIVIGVILGALAGYICNVMFFAVDFRRTEYVQYEDDEYYYYVKAVPKINVAGEDVKVKQINARKTRKASDISDVRQAKSTTAATEEDEDTVFDEGKSKPYCLDGFHATTNMVIPGIGNNFCLTTADVFNTMGRVCGPAADNNTEELIGGKPSHSGEYDEDMQDDLSDDEWKDF